MRSVLCVTLFLAACAADPATSTNQPEQDASDMVCTREYPTGSTIPITKCRSRDQVDAERRVGQDTLRRNQTGTAATKMGGN